MALSPTTQDSPRRMGRYELIRELVTSSAGVTWLAHADGDPKDLTLHKIHKHMAKAPSVVEGLLTQAQAAKKLAHANVLSVLDAGVIEGEPYVVTEYGGETLAAILRGVGADGLPLPVALRISLDMLEGFAAAHGFDTPLGHGEVGPWCVHVGTDGVARVSGFGVDQAFWRFGAHFVKNLDRLSYAAPERVKSMSSTLGQELNVPDEQSDIFSAAAVVFELVTKQRLFPSKMEAAVVQKVLTSSIPTVTSVRADIGADINDALKAALTRDRAARTKTFDDFITALEGVGPALIASHEAVAELAQLARANAAKAPATATRASAPLAPRATMPLGSDPKRPTGTTTPGMPAVGVVAPSPPQRTSPGVGATNGPSANGASVTSGLPAPPPRPKGTLPGAGGAGTGGAVTIPTPSPSKPGAPPPPRAAGKTLLDSTRTSELELGDEDMQVEETNDVGARTSDEIPTAPLTKEEPDKVVVEVPPTNPLKRARPRAATLMGLQAPEEAAAAEGAFPGPAPIVVPAPALKGAPATAAKPAPAPARRGPPPPVGEKGKGVLRPAKKGAVDRVHPGAVLDAEGASYEMIAPVARGGMAVVWCAREVGSPTNDENRLGKLVAIKTMLPELYDDEEFEHMFLDESRVAAKIRHKNVAGILGLGRAEELLYLVMEWVDGETLTAIQLAAKDTTGMPGPIVLRLAADIAAGLHAAHELKDDAGHSLDLVHRDVSPANVLVDRHGAVKIVDFGIAKSKGRLHVTRASGLVKGKTPYLSPEQIGGMQIDRRSDLFSLGVLLYVLSTGKHPFRGETEIQTLENIAINTPVPPTQLVPSIPEGLEKVILRLLQKDAKQRFATAEEVETEVAAVEAKLEKPATQADVAAFVMGVIGEKLDQRLKMLEGAVEAFSQNTPKPQLNGDGKSGPFADDATIDERNGSTSRPRKAPLAEAAEPHGGANGSADSPDLVSPGFPAPAKLPVIDVPGGDAVQAAGEEAPRDFSDLADQEAVDVPAPPSSGVHLIKLIAIGVVVGLLVIGGIELVRHLGGSSTASQPTATATASVAAPTPPPKPTQTQAPTAEKTAATPPPPATDTAAVATPTSTPTAAPTIAPTPAPTQPVKPTATPPHPPYTGQPPHQPPPHNPTKPPPTFNPNTL